MKTSFPFNRFIQSVLIGFFLVTFLVPLSAHAAVDMFVKLDGVDGESLDNNHQGWIDIISLDEGLSVDAKVRPGGTAPAVFEDIVFSKLLDSTSPVLRQSLAAGTSIPSAIIELTKTCGETPVTIFRIELSDVVLTSIRLKTSVATDPLEDVAMRFRQIKWIYTPVASDCSAGTSILRGWDIETNKSL